MNNQMFCFQCEQTSRSQACTGRAGVCGKPASIANLQDELTGALIGLAQSAKNTGLPRKETYKIILEGLFTTVTNVNFNDKTVDEMTKKVIEERKNIIPHCSKCDKTFGEYDDYDLNKLWSSDEDIRSLKSLILFGIGLHKE